MALAEVLPAARKLSTTEKLKLIRILAEELDKDVDILTLEPLNPHSARNGRVK